MMKCKLNGKLAVGSIHVRSRLRLPTRNVGPLIFLYDDGLLCTSSRIIFYDSMKLFHSFLRSFFSKQHSKIRASKYIHRLL